jgi:hypothetical protein
VPASAYVIAEPASRVKDNSCVEVCPVDCIRPTLEEPDCPEAEMRTEGQRVDDTALVLYPLGVLPREPGIVLAGVGLESARRRDRPAEIILLLRMTRAGVVSVAIGGVVRGVFDQWLIRLGHFGNGSGTSRHRSAGTAERPLVASRQLCGSRTRSPDTGTDGVRAMRAASGTQPRRGTDTGLPVSDNGHGPRCVSLTASAGPGRGSGRL